MSKPDVPPSPSVSLPPLLAVGTFVVDYHKVVDHYPHERSGARVIRELVSNGGAPLNTLVNLARMQVDFPLHAAAKVGRDLDGKMILDCCLKHGIHTGQVTAVETQSTGYTDVYTVESSGQHTCFHYSGIGDTFSRKDVKLRAIKPKLLFLGSLGALGKMDNYNPEYGRRGATQLIRDARKQGITTVVEISPIDPVSGMDAFRETLAEADYLIINHRLAEGMSGLSIHDEGQFDPELARTVTRRFLECGLRKAVIVHGGSGAVHHDVDDQLTYQKGLLLPISQRVGTAGIDHAFGAGFLEGIYHGKPVQDCLKQGLAVAAVCRGDLTPSDGIQSLQGCLEFWESLARA